jgi:mRNA interferase HicA
MTSKEMIKFLKKNGFKWVEGGDGSHRKYFNEETNLTAIVPFHNGDLKKGTEQRILKDAGLK